MKVAITVWGNRISPVFDSARSLLVAEIKDGEVLSWTGIDIEMTDSPKLLVFLEKMGVHCFICGAVCRSSLRIFTTTNIEVIPFITGRVDRFLEAICQQEDLSQFHMPGCGIGRRCRISGDHKLRRARHHPAGNNKPRGNMGASRKKKTKNRQGGTSCQD